MFAYALEADRRT